MATSTRTPFDPSRQDRVRVPAESFFFEPHCTELDHLLGMPYDA